jgi:manganese transport protein
MQGLLGVRIPMITRRIITVIPALVVLALGAEPSGALVVSQVLLSLGIPFALIPLVRLTSSSAVMGEHVNPRGLTAAAWAVATIVVTLNLALLGLTFS